MGNQKKRRLQRKSESLKRSMKQNQIVMIANQNIHHLMGNPLVTVVKNLRVTEDTGANTNISTDTGQIAILEARVEGINIENLVIDIGHQKVSTENQRVDTEALVVDRNTIVRNQKVPDTRVLDEEKIENISQDTREESIGIEDMKVILTQNQHPSMILRLICQVKPNPQQTKDGR